MNIVHTLKASYNDIMLCAALFWEPMLTYAQTLGWPHDLNYPMHSEKFKGVQFVNFMIIIRPQKILIY